MLVLTRQPGEKLVIAGCITVQVVEVKGRRVRIGIDAPDDMRILRGELTCWLEDPLPELDAGEPVEDGQLALC
jgi:carbon storage regulator CsrA